MELSPLVPTERHVDSDTDTSFNIESFRYTYSGQWQHGEREGKGVEKVVFGRPTGSEGVACSATPLSREEKHRLLERRTATYQGEFHGDRRDGEGVLALPDGTVTRGPWRDGEPRTEWEEGEMDGYDDPDEGSSASSAGGSDRSLSLPNIVGISGAAGRRVGRGAGGSVTRTQWRIEYANGNVYQGECARLPNPHLGGDGASQSAAASNADPMKAHLHLTSSISLTIIPHRYGTMVNVSSGDTYTGSFRLGRRHGHGDCIYHRTGEHSEGTWVDDFPGVVGGSSKGGYKPFSDILTKFATNDNGRENERVKREEKQGRSNDGRRTKGGGHRKQWWGRGSSNRDRGTERAAVTNGQTKESSTSACVGGEEHDEMGAMGGGGTERQRDRPETAHEVKVHNQRGSKGDASLKEDEDTNKRDGNSGMGAPVLSGEIDQSLIRTLSAMDLSDEAPKRESMENR